MTGRQIEAVEALGAGPLPRGSGLHFDGRLSEVTGRVAKRACDVLVSVFGLLLLSPLYLLIGWLVKRDSAGSVFYRGKRIGKDGTPFWMYKFRTMKAVPSGIGPRITACDDPRVTHIGRILRDTKLNELPQLINVLKGEMSLVGPRPEDPKYVALYTPEQRRVLSVTPGITSIASIVYHDEEAMLSQDTLEDTYTNVIMPDKLRLDIEYVDHRSFLVDLDILLRTLLVLLPRLARAAPDIEELLFGPVQRFVRRRVSWFTLDLILGLGAVLVANLVWCRRSGPLHGGWSFGVAFVVAVALTFTVMNQICGLQRSMWSCAGAHEALDIFLSTALSTTLLLAINPLEPLGPSCPLGLIVLSGCLACFAFTMARYRSRLITGILWRWRGLWCRARRQPGRKRLLIVGTGEVGQFFAWQVERRQEGQCYEIVGFVDDDLTKRGMRIRGIEVLGNRRAILNLVAGHNVDVVVVAVPDLPPQEYRDIVDACRHTPAKVRVTPDVLQLIHEPGEIPLDEMDRDSASPLRPNASEAVSVTNQMTFTADALSTAGESYQVKEQG